MDSFCKLTRPGNETLVLACLHEVAEGVVPGKVPLDWDRLKGNMKNILPFVEKSRKKLAVDQDMIKLLRRERSIYFAQRGFSNLPPRKWNRFNSGVSMEGAGVRASFGALEAVNEADDHD